MYRTITDMLADIARQTNAQFPDETFLILSVAEDGLYHRSVQGDPTLLAYGILKFLRDFPEVAAQMQEAMHNATH